MVWTPVTTLGRYLYPLRVSIEPPRGSEGKRQYNLDAFLVITMIRVKETLVLWIVARARAAMVGVRP